ERILDISYFHVFRCLVFIHNHKDHLGKFDAKVDDGYFLGYSFVSKAFRVFNTRRQQIKETYHDDPSRQYQTEFDISYYVIPHGHSLSELSQKNQVPEVIASNEPDIPHTKDTKGPLELINTEGTPKQNVQNDQMITQPTDVPSRNNTKVSRSIIKSLFLDVTLSHISNQDSTSSHHIPQDRWIDGDQHIELVNIIGDPGKGMLTRMARIEAIRIFLSFPTYMNFKVYQMDVKSAFLNGKLKEEIYVKQPPGFESSEFPDYVCKLDKALYGLKQAPRACPMCKISVQSKEITSNNCEKNPQSVAMSSAEAEYVAYIGCCASILWMKSQLSDYDIHYKMVPIFCDNTSAIAISNNPVLL
nr:retrovirus-related Pol polyprotein from transposon TNT 1-94 [Tanacetum cinerariifolium]